MKQLKTCSIAGCGKPIGSRGWCAAHYMRWLRYGSPDINNTPRWTPTEDAAILAAKLMINAGRRVKDHETLPPTELQIVAKSLGRSLSSVRSRRSRLIQGKVSPRLRPSLTHDNSDNDP